MNEPSEDRRKLRTRTATLQAFSSLFLEHGYEAVTMAQVAERADVGRSTLYEHFRTKEDLLQAALERPLAALAAAIEPDAGAGRLPGMLDHIRTHAAVARVVLAQPLRSRIARLLAGRLAGAMTAGGQPSPLAVLRASALAEAQLAVVERWVFGPVALPTEAVAQELVRLARAVTTD